MNKNTIKRSILILLVPVIIFTGSGFLKTPDNEYFEISKNLDIFGKVYREVHSYYVDDVDPTQFMRTGIESMLASLDPYTNYISASEIEDYRFMSTGQYGGIGAVIGKRDDMVIITEPYEGYPADKAGLRAGDVIIKIDDEDLTKLDSKTLDVRNLLRGQPKTKVNITVKREGVAAPISVDVERDDIKIKNVPYYGMIDSETGYISLTGFTAGAAKEVKAALEDLKNNNPGIGGVVLDLRGNPGGLLFEAVDISNIFVDKGEKIVETRGKIEGSLKAFTASNNPVDTEIPLVVMVNRRSASASEIVSGTMQDLDRGVIVGQRSFGKGLVQTTRPLSYNSQLKITTAKYYTPSGRCIQALDYSHRNEDGSVGTIPDSLKKEFKTRRGRSVWDGGGVEPDVKVETPEYHTVTRELIRQNIVFDFATRYRSQHDQIPGARKFQISDELYNEFVAFCKEKDFKFETRTEKEFSKLKDLIKEESYFDELETELNTIDAKMSEAKKNDLMAFKAEISNFIKSEIVSRYYFKNGTIEASFDMDPDVLEAVKVLKDKDQYNKILGAN